MAPDSATASLQAAKAPSAASRLLWLLVGLTALTGLLLTAFAARAGRAREEARRATEFQSETRALARAVEREVGLFNSVLASLGELHTLSDAISGEVFAEFVGKGLLHQKAILGPFGFAQRIPHSLRDAFEGRPPTVTPILEWREGRISPAAVRLEYYPLTYQSPENALGLPIGFDLATLPGNAAAIARLLAGGGPALGASIAGPDPAAPPGFFVLAPIREQEELRGFTLARLWPQELLERAQRQMRSRPMQITLFDPAFAAPPPSERARYFAEWPLWLADQPWTLRFEAGQEYDEAWGPTRTPLVWAGGTAVTLLMALAIGLIAGRAKAVERLVALRTTELVEANRRLAAEMEERARLEEALHTSAARERQRIGQDLHDSLGQKLTGAVYLARALENADDQTRRELIEKLVDLLKDSIAQVRRTARGLAPLEVGESGLSAGLRRLAEDTCSMFNIACSFVEQGAPPDFPAEAAVNIYYIAQEAVHNAIRHGHANEIRLELTATGLTITDNGCGFDPQRVSDGSGLRIMRHRASRAGGSLTIESSHAGTTVRVSFPSSKPSAPTLPDSTGTS